MTTFDGRAVLVFVLNSAMAINCRADVRLARTEAGWSGAVKPPTDDDALAFAMFGSPFLVELDGVEVEFEFGEPNGAGEYQVWERGTAPALTTPCPQCGHGMYRGTVLIGLVEENDVRAEYSCMPCGRRFRRPNSDAAWEPA